MSLQFSRLELRELLSHVDRLSLDPDVLAKLEYGATNLSAPNPARLVTPQHSPIYTPEQVDVLVGAEQPRKRPDEYMTGPDNSEFKPLVWNAGLKYRAQDGSLQPFTQEMIDQVNEQTRMQWDMEQKIKKNYKPIVGEENAANPGAAYAPPDVPPKPIAEHVAIGAKNRWGDECAAYQGDDAVYRCKEGHGYIYSRGSVTAGCPQCFLGGVTSDTGPAEARDQDTIAGEDSAW